VRTGSMLFKSASVLHRAKVLPLMPASLLTSLARDEDTVTIVSIEPFRRRQDVANRLEQSGLSRREVTVALCVMRGLSNAGIGKQLFIDEKTVKDHLQRVYDKIRVRTRTGLISKMLGLDTELAPVEDSSNFRGGNDTCLEWHPRP
jgi:DNA-binding NarL/FixJ family response regulator